MCEECENRFTTYERPSLPLLVRKRDGRVEPLELDKVRVGVQRALAGRRAAEGAVLGIVERVADRARQSAPEFTSVEIGRLVLAGLKELDEVGYLRFASVYKDFQGASDFEKEMAELDEP